MTTDPFRRLAEVLECTLDDVCVDVYAAVPGCSWDAARESVAEHLFGRAPRPVDTSALQTRPVRRTANPFAGHRRGPAEDRISAYWEGRMATRRAEAAIAGDVVARRLLSGGVYGSRAW